MYIISKLSSVSCAVNKEWDWPATWGDGSIRIGYLVRVDRGQHLSFQVPDVDTGVGGGTHDKLACGWETQYQPHKLVTNTEKSINQ